MDATELVIPDVAAVLAADPSVPTDVMIPLAGCRPLLGGLFPAFTFDSMSWRVHRRVWGCSWDRAGVFGGKIAITVNGPRQYHYAPDPDDPFYFLRPSGEMVKPGSMVSDGGSVPRVAWAVPGLDPWTYLASYLIHDWMFGDSRATFEDANLTLGQALYTQMTAAAGPFKAPEDWRVAWAVHAAVSSVLGRRAWAACRKG